MVEKTLLLMSQFEFAKDDSIEPMTSSSTLSLSKVGEFKRSSGLFLVNNLLLEVDFEDFCKLSLQFEHFGENLAAEVNGDIMLVSSVSVFEGVCKVCNRV